MFNIIEGIEMNALLTNFYLYRGSEVDDDFANYLIDKIYREGGLKLLNLELELSE